MTLATQASKIVYVPDGAQTLYAVVFPLFSPQDVQCFVVDAAGRESEITDFTVEGFGTESGVYVRFAEAPAAGGSLVLRRNTRQVQETAYPEGGKFPSAVVENDFDRVVGMIQELGEAVDRSLKVNVSEEAPPESAEELYLRVQEVLADAEGARDFSQANAASANQSAVNAAASRDAAAGSAELARKWAENPEDTPVLPDHYSAFHWAQKARQNAAEGITLSDDLEGNRNAEAGVGASEWALSQVNAKAEGAQAAADEAMEAIQNIDALPLFSLIPCPTGILRPGFLFPYLDNGLLTKAAFPQAYTQLAADAAAGSTAILLGDEAWQTEKLANGGVCARFMLDVDAETFRIPLTPGLYQREPDPGKGTKAGDYQIDTMRPITGSLGGAYSPFWTDMNPTGALSFSGTTGTRPSTWAGGADTRYLGLNSALLGPNYSGDETRPVTAAIPMMMKMYGAVVDASEASIAALIAATVGKLDTAQFEQIPFKNVWISNFYEVVFSTVTSATHNLNLIEPEKALCIVELVCVVANNGYAVGDVAPPLQYPTTQTYAETRARLYRNTAEVTAGASSMQALVKNTGTYLTINTSTAPNWRWRFRIWY